MAAKDKALAFAKSLLTPKNIAIAEAIVQKHFADAMDKKDQQRLIELTELVNLVQSIKANESSK